MKLLTKPAETTAHDVAGLYHHGYLRPSVKLEPLMGRWPLWPHLLGPAQYAMNLAFRLLPSLQSFLENPSVHVAAASDPKLFGGPFVALSEEDQPAVRALLQEMTARSEPLLRFAREFKTLDLQLTKTATGYALDEYYKTLPESLAGLVEFVYDLNNHPKIRLFEALTYESELDRKSDHSFCLHVVDDEKRPFFMSTPLLDAPNRLFFQAEYGDAIVDDLAAARLSPGVPASVRRLLDQTPDGNALLPMLFTTDAPSRVAPEYHGDGVRMRYFGHACVLIQSADVSILVDPSAAWQRNDTLATLTFDDLPDTIDYVVITHAHQDHLVAETLLQLRSRVRTIVVPPADRGNLADPSMRLMLERLGFTNVVCLEHFQALKTASGEIVGVPFVGEHGGIDIASKQCVVVRAAGRSFLFMVDSDAVDRVLSARIAKRIGPLDVAFVGMECKGAPMSWLYGPLLTTPLSRKDNQSRRFSGSDCDRAWDAITALGCKTAFVYAMGQEPWMRHLMGLEYTPESVQLQEAKRFVDRCGEHGIRARRLYGCYEEFFR